MKQLTDKEIEKKALEIRRLIIRMVHAATCGHPGGSLGLADIFAVLYFDILRHRPGQPDWPDRDVFVLSNGHVSPVRYAAMKLAGYFRDLDVMSFRKLGSPFQGHPSTRYLPELENSSGSLGQGLSAAVGLALGQRLQKRKGRVFCGISDGECGEGMTWEAATAAVAYRAPVIAYMDHNGIQIDGKTRDVCDLGDLASKFAAFGWKVSTIDGHDVGGLRRAFSSARDYEDGPQMIVCNTVLGKGVSFMEDDYNWHGKAPNQEQTELALAELA
ncbi:MAG: transketolase [Spirochaetales bacterium]|nr:transketolase [Leptospiraceae bacterium]MCP5480850.1 transketolase [Spirochaetales bacterium]